MENNIELEEYIRSKDGIIIQIDWIGNAIVTNKEDTITISKKNIIKHNKDLLKLIEYGDVLKIKEDNSVAYLGLTKPETTMTLEDIIQAIREGKIELLEVLTKEQFNSNSYKVGVLDVK